MTNTIVSLKMKSRTYFSLRSQGLASKHTYRSETEALEAAKTLCLEHGSEVSIVMHEGDVSRLTRKVFAKR